MTLPIIIIGAGGHSNVLVDIARLLHRNIIGIVDANPRLTGTSINGCLVLGDDTYLDSLCRSDFLLVNGVGSTSVPTRRKQIFDKLKRNGFSFDVLCHPSSIISPSAVISEGCQIMAGAVIQPYAKILPNTIVNTRASIDHETIIDQHCHISPGSVICGSVSIESTCHIGAGSVVLQSVHIGHSTLVGAGSVVIKDIPANSVVAGIPASPLQLND